MRIIEGNIVDVHGREVFPGSVAVEDGRIVSVRRHQTPEKGFILPGFVDSHVHIESSMLTPENFGRLAVRQGTVAVVTDPHEIANVCGMEGIEFMLRNSGRSPVKCFFTIPSCVPATGFDRSAGVVSGSDVAVLAESGKFVGLSEMMNVHGVVNDDPEIVRKIGAAKAHDLPVDGHAPLATGDVLREYVARGVVTDHECTSLSEAREKVGLGMKIQIREGSAAKNYEELRPLIGMCPDRLMFCTDDAHPQQLISEGHIRGLVARSVGMGYDLFDVLRIASVNPVEHYGLDVGLLREGDKADFIIVEDLKDFEVREVFIEGKSVLDFQAGEDAADDMINVFEHDPLELSSLKKEVGPEINVMKLVPDQLLTELGVYRTLRSDFESDTENDILKIVYVNRYFNGEPQVAFCKGFGLRKGAVASSVAHDSHNIIAVGTNDADLLCAINSLVECKGGLCVVNDGEVNVLPLPIGGIMSPSAGEIVAAEYDALEGIAKDVLGCPLNAPFMTLSFLSLVVIPEVKIGEKGLFSFSKFGWFD